MPRLQKVGIDNRLFPSQNLSESKKVQMQISLQPDRIKLASGLEKFPKHLANFCGNKELRSDRAQAKQREIFTLPLSVRQYEQLVQRSCRAT